ncbi:MAG TPA: sigma 54-interacting transcriptional regulator, partial [Anaerovoracaceae bacterium]|nr:sigma 54-interacting transcriptional regulator [Anaerovoracaceae bacterium]
GCIDSALTYEEISRMFRNITRKDENQRNEKMVPYYAASPIGRQISFSGGIVSNYKGRFPDERLNICDGIENCIELIKHIERTDRNGEQEFQLYDVLSCRGCIDGTYMENDLLIQERRKIILDFISRKEKLTSQMNFTEQYEVDLCRAFQNRMIPLSQPDEESIKAILARIDKHSEDDELNCGACGYNSCREKAIAVYQGIAEVEMCIPYLLAQKNACYLKISAAFETVNDLNEQLNAIFESSYDGMIACDAAGKIIKANNAWRNMVGVEEVPEKEEDLEDSKTLYPSAALLALKEKRRVTFLQECKNGRKFIATGNPIFRGQDEMIGVVTNIRDIEELSRLTHNVLKKKEEETTYSGIIIKSKEFNKVMELAVQAAKFKSTVLLLGETGVGKEVIARLIHNLSPFKDGPFVKVNCGAIPENLLESEFFGYEYGAFTGAKKDGKIGFFEEANNGTIFLDEIGDLPLSLQVKLLQVIQDKTVRRIGASKSEAIDVRIVAATNINLGKIVQEGKFREDLYYRLNVISIQIPPLRERKDDIVPLAYHFLDVFNNQYGSQKEFGPDVPEILGSYYWPGNIRELENLIERIVVISKGSEITGRDIPPYVKQVSHAQQGQIIVNSIVPLKYAISEVEKQIINHAYKVYGNTYKMAEVLGVNQSTVVRKLKQIQDQNK